MSNAESRPVLVAGATGLQGGAVVRALLKAGRRVRALSRDPGSAVGRALAARGVEVVKGDFFDPASLDAAAVGAVGVFSMQHPSPPGDPTAEIRAGRALAEAAYRAEVDVIVHTSVARAGEQESFVGWSEGRWGKLYWENKTAVNELIKARGFRNWVILKPALIMENLLPPINGYMFPTLATRGRFDTALEPDTRTFWIAGQDIGAFAVAAFADPARFNGHEISLASERVTMQDIADKIAKAAGKSIAVVTSTEEELVASGYYPPLARNQIWSNVEGYKVDIDAARRWGVPLTTFDQFVDQHRDEFVIG